MRGKRSSGGSTRRHCRSSSGLGQRRTCAPGQSMLRLWRVVSTCGEGSGLGLWGGDEPASSRRRRRAASTTGERGGGDPVAALGAEVGGGGAGALQLPAVAAAGVGAADRAGGADRPEACPRLMRPTHGWLSRLSATRLLESQGNGGRAPRCTLGSGRPAAPECSWGSRGRPPQPGPGRCARWPAPTQDVSAC